MKAVVFLAALGLFVAAAAAAAPLLAANSATKVQDSYIVVFKQISKAARESHIKRVKGLATSKFNAFNIGDFTGYSAVFTNNTLTTVLNMPEVAYVECDQTVQTQQACATQINTPTWGIDRIAEVDINLLDSEYPHDPTWGADVDAYIVDTGVLITHVDFGTRATWGFNSVDTNDNDCNGHGTHVAGTVGGTLYGVAKQANIIAVKVLNCQGSGTFAGVIAGVDYVAAQHKVTGKASVANMSLGGGFTAALNAAVAAAVAAGVSFVVAAGNSNDNACNYSPASEPSAISVGSTAIGVDINGNPEDDRSSFSNVGTCVDVFAPGSLITSAWIGSNTATNTISGTSMASPHICGIAATILSANPTLTPAQVQAQIVNTATAGKINLGCTTPTCSASPNLLGFATCS